MAIPEAIAVFGLLAKRESTYRTDPTPAAASDAVRLSEALWQVLTVAHEFENERDETASGNLLPVAPATPHGRIVTLDVGVEPQPKGSAYTVGTDLKGLSAMLRMAGLSETVATSGLDYVPIHASMDSATLYAYGANKLYKALGCRTAFTVPITPGEMGLIRFQAMGILEADPTEVATPTITYLSTEAPADTGLTLTIAAYTPEVVGGEFRSGQNVVRLLDANDAQGIGRIVISQHRPSLLLSILADSVSNYDPHADKAARTVRIVSLTRGSSAGSQMKLQDVDCYVRSIGHGEHEGHATHEIEYLVTDWKLRFD